MELTQAEVSCGAAKVDLDLSLETRAEGVMAPLLCPDLFSAATLHRMVDHWYPDALGDESPDADQRAAPPHR